MNANDWPNGCSRLVQRLAAATRPWRPRARHHRAHVRRAMQVTRPQRRGLESFRPPPHCAPARVASRTSSRASALRRQKTVYPRPVSFRPHGTETRVVLLHKVDEYSDATPQHPLYARPLGSIHFTLYNPHPRLGVLARAAALGATPHERRLSAAVSGATSKPPSGLKVAADGLHCDCTAGTPPAPPVVRVLAHRAPRDPPISAGLFSPASGLCPLPSAADTARPFGLVGAPADRVCRISHTHARAQHTHTALMFDQDGTAPAVLVIAFGLAYSALDLQIKIFIFPG